MHSELAAMFGLSGRVALVTGGASNLGYDAAAVLASAGCDVIVTSRSIERAKRAAARLAVTYGAQTIPLALTPLLSSITLNWVQAPDRHEYELVGTLGWVHLDLTSLTLTHGDRITGTVETEAFAVEPDDIYRAEHEAFFAAVEGRQTPESTAEDGIAAMRHIEAMIESWRTSAKVDLVVDRPDSDPTSGPQARDEHPTSMP